MFESGSGLARPTSVLKFRDAYRKDMVTTTVCQAVSFRENCLEKKRKNGGP